MAFTYQSEFVFIGRGDESFLENYSYELANDPVCQGGKIFMALEILNNQAEAEDIGEAVFATFKQKFFEDPGQQAFERFEAALKEANRTIEALKEEKVSRFIGNVNIAIGAITDDTLYISTTGDADVYLVRKRFVSILSEGLAEENKHETFVNIANGTLEQSDVVLFSSTRLLRYITKAEMGKIFHENTGGHIGDSLTELADFIMTEILGRSAVVGVSVGEPVSEFEPEEEVRSSISAPAWLVSLKRFIPSGGKLGNLMPRFAFGSSWFTRFREKLRGMMPAEMSPKKILPKFSQGSWWQRLTRQQILLSAAVLLILLIIGTFWIRNRSIQSRIIQEQQAKLNHVKEIINDAVTTGQFDKSKAAELLQNGEKEALEVLNSRFLRNDAVKTLDDINRQRDALDDVKRIPTPQVIADFSEKRSTASALGLIALKSRLFGFEYNALYEMVLDKLQDPLTIDSIETIILGTDFPDQDSLLFLTRTGKMIEYKDARFSTISTKDGIWKKGVDMESYHERLYVLDPERNQIWRYARRREGFDIGEGYNQNAELNKAVALAIDAAVYVLNSDGVIIQLYQGQKQDYPLRRLPLVPMTAPTRIYTNAELNRIFILEPAQQRVVIFRKDPKNGGAQYQTQYVFGNTGVLRDLTVSDNRLYVMDDKKVYFVNLSGLL